MNYGLLGEKLSHSFSPRIHEKLGNKEYGLFSVAGPKLHDFLTKREFRGINVTIPYKQAVIPYLSEISEGAKKIGSVNTIVRADDGRLFGYNTDYMGLSYLARANGISFSAKKVLILGSGGTSLTAEAVARDEGAREVIRVSRNGADNYGNIARHSDAEILINTTPVGMYPNNGERLLDIAPFKALCGVIDVIYNPFYTELLLDAKARGIPHSNGLLMLVAQAKYASDLFFGKDSEADPRHDETIRRIYRELSAELSNVVLIGMPSAGKTSVGRLLSEKLGKTFIDMDAEIVRESGKSIPEIFAACGEAGFRELETEAAKRCGRARGAVIATGGGTVLRAENMRALKQNGTVVYIRRALSELSGKGRPLSKDYETLCRMYEVRRPLYEGYAELCAENRGADGEKAHGGAEACAEEIVRLLRAFSEEA